jgi:asparagine N-glycosylation enzyme membrane subunit Stt3
MPAWLDDERGARLLRWTAAVYGVAWAIHNADHLRRGTDVVTTDVLVLGAVAGVLQVLAVSAVFLKHRSAAVLALAVGLPAGIGIVAVHLLPRWSSFSDALPGAHGTGITLFSWVAVVLETASAFAFAAAGAYVLHRTRTRAPSQARSPAALVG